MLGAVIPIKLATTIMSAWIASSAPIPIPGAALALAFDQVASEPVELVIHDDNRGGIETRIVRERDGTQDTAWTEVNGQNGYRPYWAVQARQAAPPPRRGPGV